MKYPVVDKQRYRLLGYNNDQNNCILQYIQDTRAKEHILKNIDIPKEIYEKFNNTYNLNDYRLELYKKNTKNMYYNISLELDDIDTLNFVLEDGYDIDTIDIYLNNDKNIPNILFKTDKKTFAFNKANYIIKNKK